MIAIHGQNSVSLKWNLQTFNETIRRAIQESSRSAPQVVNGHALGVAAAAIKLTEKASKGEIERKLGQTGLAPNYTKRGRVSTSKKFVTKRRILSEDSFASRIVNARRRDYAGPDYMLWGNALEEAAKMLITARVKAIGFIRSGWIWALRDLSAAVGRRRIPPQDRSIIVTSQRKGGAIPARPGPLVKAVIYNTALVQSGGKFQAKGTHNPWPIAERGLVAALKAEQANFFEHSRQKMLEAMKRAKAA